MAITDCTAGDDTLAIHCLKRRVPYVGFTLSAAHISHLKQRCIQALMGSVVTEGEDMYDPNIAKYLTTTPKHVETSTVRATGGGGGGAAAGGRTKKQKKNLQHYLQRARRGGKAPLGYVPEESEGQKTWARYTHRACVF